LADFFAALGFALIFFLIAIVVSSLLSLSFRGQRRLRPRISGAPRPA
jgi:hypothetical protein